MNIQVEKAALIKELELVNDESLIRALQSMIDYATKRDEEYLGESIDSYNHALDEADAQINKGDFVTHEDALTRIRAWRKGEQLSGAE